MSYTVYYSLNENQTIKKMSMKPFEGSVGTTEIDNLPIQYYNNFSKVVNGNFVLRETEYKHYMDLKKEKQEILQWLSDNDWKINKIVIGEWSTTDYRWTSYLDERYIKRLRLDEVVTLISEYDYES